MTIDRHCMRGLTLGLSLLTEPALARTAIAPMGRAPAPMLQPATGGRIGQPPANSAMRRAGSTGAAGSAAPNRWAWRA